jgi:hypothetical protein
MSDPLLFVDTSESNVTVTGNLHVTNSLHIYKAAAEGTSGLFIEKASGGAGTTAALFFGVNAPGENPGVAKAAIFYERNLVNGRGDIKFCNDAVNDTNAVTTEATDTRMIIKNNGNVGVGINIPEDKLHTDVIRIGNWSGSGNGYKFSLDTNAYLRLQYMTGQTVFKDIMTLRYDNGYVGIGTVSPSSQLHVMNELIVQTTNGQSAAGYGVSMKSNTGMRWTWAPGNDNWLRLYGTGMTGNQYDGNYKSMAVGTFWSCGATRFSSDDRVKHFEEEIPALEIINQLNPYKYKKTSKIYTEDYTGEIGEEGVDWVWEIGLIAQDIKKIPYLEFAVSNPEDGPEGKYGLNYTNFIGVCVQGIKEMDQKLQTEKARNNSLEARILALEKRIN